MKLIRECFMRTETQYLKIEVWECMDPECRCLQITVYDMLQPYRKGSSAMGAVIQHMNITRKEWTVDL